MALSFEQALAELEKRVVRLEHGELELDEALKVFEEGVSLVRECHEKLDDAELRIATLSRDGEAVRETSFPGGSTEDDR